MAIISASRRTDIPTFFSDWFMNRLRSGEVLVRNPYKPEQVSKIILSQETVDCIVFWTKNPISMLSHLKELNSFQIPYYFQFTLTGYGKDIETHIPNKKVMLEAFKNLCSWGNGYVIWRYDPIVFTERYTPEYHLRAFKAIASELRGYTDKCVISFVDVYPNNERSLITVGNKTLVKDELAFFCKQLSDIAKENGMTVGTCAEIIDLDFCGIVHNKCIDPDYIEKIIGVPIKDRKDANQRKECGCVESIDIGTYSTCKNGCKYCYACKDTKALERNFAKYDPYSPLLCDSLRGNEKITTRTMNSMKDYKAAEKDMQTTLF